MDSCSQSSPAELHHLLVPVMYMDILVWDDDKKLIALFITHTGILQ